MLRADSLNPEGARSDDAQLRGRDALKQGLSLEAAEFICETAKCGSTPPPPMIRTVAHYQDAWVLHARRDHLSISEVEQELERWKLESPHGG